MMEVVLKIVPYFLIINGIFDLILYTSKTLFDKVNTNLNGVFQPSFRTTTIFHGIVRLGAGCYPSQVTIALAFVSYFIEWYYVYSRVNKITDCVPIVFGFLPIMLVLLYWKIQIN